MKKRILSILLLCCMVLTLLPTAAFAANELPDVKLSVPATFDKTVDLTKQNGELKIKDSKTYLIKGSADPNWYFQYRIKIDGKNNTPHIFLDGVRIQAPKDGPAIELYGGASACLYFIGNDSELIGAENFAALQKNKTDGYLRVLVQTGTKLTCEGGRYGAGIGGSKVGIKKFSQGHGMNLHFGSLATGIYGGEILAISGVYGAGIGGGQGGVGEWIYVYSGKLTVRSVSEGAGIGGGQGGPGRFIYIKGGTVNAGSESGGAGIGSGDQDGQNKSEDAYHIEISGGTVEAWSNYAGAGIGGGRGGSGYDISITGGVVRAQGYYGAGIGGGMKGKSGNILIKDTTLTALALPLYPSSDYDYNYQPASAVGRGSKWVHWMTVMQDQEFAMTLEENIKIEASDGKSVRLSATGWQWRRSQREYERGWGTTTELLIGHVDLQRLSLPYAYNYGRVISELELRCEESTHDHEFGWAIRDDCHIWACKKCGARDPAAEMSKQNGKHSPGDWSNQKQLCTVCGHVLERDTKAPVMETLTDGESYTVEDTLDGKPGAYTFTVSDPAASGETSSGVKSVTITDVPQDGPTYRLPAPDGGNNDAGAEYTVVATDNAGNETTATVRIYRRHHEHNYGDWSKDGTSHWHECTDYDCPNRNESIKDKAAHVYTDDADTTCNTCDYDRSVTPPAPTEYTITVTSGGNGTASASHAKAMAGAEITLTATPNKGYHFKEWQVMSGGVTIKDDKFTMPSANVEVKAIFEEDAPPAPTEYTVTVTNDGNGTASASPAKAATGTEITLTATPKTGYHLKEWEVIRGNVTIKDDKFTMPHNNVEIKAIFEKDAPPTPTEYTVTVTTAGGGTASASPAKAAAGTEITLTATPNTGYHFKEWQVISGNVTIKDDKFLMPDSNVEIKAIFEKDAPPTPTEYTVTVTSSGNGTASASPSKAVAGAEITLSATPDKGYHLKEWQVESPTGLVITNNKFTMPNNNVEVKAIFEEDTPPAPTEHTVTVTSGGNGTASASPAKAAAGTEITLTATPNTGYHFKEWQVISGNVTIKDDKFLMPDSNVEVKAIFEEDAPPAPTDPAKPSISVTGTYTYNGSEHTATVSGYDPATMDISGNTATDAGDYTVSVTSKTGKWADGSTDAVTTAWSIGKATQEAPAGLNGVAPSDEGGSDGKITGVTDKMEYRMEAEGSYTPCSGAEIENLSAGHYFVRYAEDNNHFASSDAAVTVGEGASLADWTITFNAGGGSGNMDSVTVKTGTNYILPECGFTAPTDQEFKAWEISGTEYKVGDTYIVSGDTEIKALWENSVITPTTYTVTVGNDGNGTGTASPSTAAAGTTITLTATPKTGYHFKEWEVISGGVTIKDDKFLMPNDNVEIKAIFEEDAPPVPTDPAKPNISVTGTYTYNGSVHTATVNGYDLATMDISGNTATDAGDYTVRVTSKTGRWADGSTDAVTAAWSIGKATQEAPNGLIGVAPTTEGGGDGKISGVTDKMEYRMADKSIYTACSGTEIENLSAGNYFVRYAEDNNHFAGPDVAVTVGEGAPLADCTITFNGNGGSGSMEPVTVKAETNYILPECGFTAPADQEFKAWEIGGTEYKVGDSYTVNGDIEIKALWKNSVITPSTYTVTVSNDGNGTGAATPSTAAVGTEITLTATPDTGYHFKEWQVMRGNVTIKDDKFTMPDSDVEVKAIFEEDTPPAPTEHTVTVTSGGNGTASASPAKGAAGAEITLSATPDKGYHLKEWQVMRGNVTIKDDKFTMPDNNVEVKAIFEKDTPPAPTEHTVTVTSGGNGTASASPAKAVAGAEITLSATPDKGYHLKEWQVVSPAGLVITNNKFTMPDTNVAIKAIFEEDAPPAPTEFTITVKTDGNGTASASHAKAVVGTEITLTAKPNKGYHFKEWEVISGGVTIKNNKFIMPSANVEVKAIFEEDVPALQYKDADKTTPAPAATATPQYTIPQTGDTSNPALLVVLMLVSGSAAIGTAVVASKKKHNR